MNAHDILPEEIKHQPEPLMRELPHCLDLQKRQRAAKAPMGES